MNRHFRSTLLVLLIAALGAMTAISIASATLKRSQTNQIKDGDLREESQSFPFTMTKGKGYLINLKSKAFDAYLILRAPNGEKVGEDDDSGGGLNARLAFLADQSGTYQIEVTSFDKKGKGPFTLSIKELLLARNDKLTTKDPLDTMRKQSHAKSYDVKLEKGKNYLIDLQSSEFDAYLRVEDSTGTQVAEDDDSGGNFNSRLVYTPNKTDTFKIVVTSFAPGDKGVGAFDLIVLQPSPEELKSLAPAAALIGNPAPDLIGSFALNGSAKKLSDFKGKVVLIDFWAVWCGPCIKTFPHLRDWHKQYADKGLVVLGATSYFERFGFDKDKGNVQVLNEKISPMNEHAMLKNFLAHHQLSYPVLVLSKENWQMAGQNYGFTGIPTAALIDREGNVRLIRTGASEENAQALEAEIKKLLAQ